MLMEEFESSLTDYEKEMIEKNKEWSIDTWLSFSLAPQSEEDIRRRALIDAVYDIHPLCYSYICQSSILSEKFIKELLFITSPLFSFSYYNEKYIDIVNKIIAIPLYNRRKKIDLFITENRNDLCDEFINKLQKFKQSIRQLEDFKLDWYTIINYQNISREFVNNYIDALDERTRDRYWRTQQGGDDIRY